MNKFNCPDCEYVFHDGETPNPDKWYVLSDRKAEAVAREVATRAAADGDPEMAFYGALEFRFVTMWRCPSCGYFGSIPR